MEKSKVWKGIGIATVVLFLALLFGEGIVAEYKLANNYRFTVAVTKGYGGGGFVNFEFSVNGVTYKRSNKGKQLIPDGRKYFVKYYVDDPSLIAKIVSNDEVPDCVSQPPANGWKEIPQCK